MMKKVKFSKSNKTDLQIWVIEAVQVFACQESVLSGLIISYSSKPWLKINSLKIFYYISFGSSYPVISSSVRLGFERPLEEVNTGGL